MKTFQLAAERQVEREEGEEEPILEFNIGDQAFKSKIATTGQITLVVGSLSLGQSKALGGVYRFLSSVLLEDGYRRITQLIDEGKLDFDLLFGGNDENDGNSVVEWIISESTERPTQEPAGSSPSQKPAGQRSTGRSPGRGSTLSS